MTFDEFKKCFIIKGGLCGKTGKDLWTIKEKAGNYEASGLTEHAVLWELQRCFESRKLRGSIND